MMIPVLLTRIKTRDGVMLDGIYAQPLRQSKTVLIWLHGLSSKFYSGHTLIGELSKRCARSGVGYFKFNTRGHDIITREPAMESGLGGTAFEKFEDCVLDIRAIIRLAKKLGYQNIILAGHSTGANKALYYLYKTQDRGIQGLLLLSPASDIDFDMKKFGKNEAMRRLTLAKELKTKKPFALLPQGFGVWTAQRLVSLLSKGTPEDVFPYYNPRARWKELKSASIPIAVVFGSRDEHLTLPAKKLIEVFRVKAGSTKSFSGITIKGADHGFVKKEKELARTIIRWIKRAIV